MTHVVIVESPAKCKTINKYLGKNYKVLASYGHVRDLPSKNGSVLPEKDFEILYQVSPNSKKHIKAIEDAMKGAESLILATDPDREGEAISWHVLEVLKKNKIIPKGFPVKRVSFNSITKSAVEEAMANPRDLDMDLVNSQQARRALDYLVGFTLSPVLWRKLPGSRSAGRVQSVALRIICDRENEIERFRADEYWSIHANFLNPDQKEFSTNLTYAFNKKIDKLTINNKEQADKILAGIKNQQFSVSQVEKKNVSRHPKPPFTTSTLQQEASRKLGFSAKKTMMVAQRLYEGVNIGGETTGLITYMRTDGLDVAPEAIVQTREAIEKNFGKKYLPEAQRIYKSKQKSAQEAHEAIRPTDSLKKPDQLSQFLEPDQLKLYELIWKRMMASQMESALLNQVSADILSTDKQFTFRATGQTIVFDGFFRLYHEDVDDGEDEDKEGILPPLNEGDKLELAKVEEGQNPAADQHFTQPPPRYNEASLVKKLEELGIGRPSTYAAILSVLQDRGYVKLDKRRFIPEMRGRLVTAFLEDFFHKYVEYDFTADLENELDQISEGKLEWHKALQNFWGDFKANVDQAMEIRITEVLDKLDKDLEHVFFQGDDIDAARVCPKCKIGRLSLKTGKFGAFLGCSNYPTCDYTQQIDNFADRKASEDADAQSGMTEEELKAEKEKVAKFETKVIGIDGKTGEEITLRVGPYGLYVQLGEAKDKKSKPKRASIAKGTPIESITLEKAEHMLSLPRLVGKHPVTGEEILASIGRFGPYLSHNKQFFSLKEKEKLYTIELDEAVTIVDKPKQPRGFKAKAKPEGEAAEAAPAKGKAKAKPKAKPKSASKKAKAKPKK